MKKFKSWLLNGIIVGISCVIALLLCEVATRLTLDPVDYLSPRLVRDPVLGIRLPPHSSGHDAWGFRNKSVPKSADIVVVGDSHTYGNCAKMSEAWPHVLSRLQHKQVYNLGMGGYGPNQYYEMFQTRGLSLKPHTVVCGLYLGDDFDNAYRITYGLPYWSSRRRHAFDNVDPDIWQKDSQPSFQKRFRNWLSGRSVLYRVVVHGLLANTKARLQAKDAPRSETALLLLPEKNVHEAFLPKGLLRGLKEDEPSVREGKRITYELLKEMNGICVSNQIRFVVALIPTKETVFATYLEGNSKLDLSDTLGQVIANERLAREELLSTLKQENIPFVDLLPSMRKAIEQEKIYTPSISDMHPNNNGYRVMAEAISGFLSAGVGK